MGQGVDKKIDEDVKFLTLAAERGSGHAQRELAELYASGTGVQRDFQKAYSLYFLAGRTLDVSKQLIEISSRIENERSATQVSRLQQEGGHEASCSPREAQSKVVLPRLIA